MAGPDPSHRVVGRVGRPHGLRGDLTVEVRTDRPGERFAPGARLGAGNGRTVVVEDSREHSGRLLVRFVGCADRTAAEGLRGVLLTVPVDELPDIEDPDEFHDHQLEGLTAVDPSGGVIGTVREVVHLPAGDVLEIADTAGDTLLVPFTLAIVPHVDLAAGRLVVDAPDGLFDPS